MTSAPYASQLSFPGLCEVDTAAANMATRTDEERGAVFTRREVVDFMLDLIGYTPDQPLHQYRLLEPSFGDGHFIGAILERLFVAYARAGGAGDVVGDLGACLTAVELHEASYRRTRQLVRDTLLSKGVRSQDAERLCDRWLRNGDFLLMPLSSDFTHVIGNPPYVRQELIPDTLLAAYRRRFSTIYDRADLYVPFIERSLSLMVQGGTLGFICADRWMKNRYGGPLRRFISRTFHVRSYVDMVDTDAFMADVIAYPAIFVISRERAGPTRVAYRPRIDRAVLCNLAAAMTAPTIPENTEVVELSALATGPEPWVFDSSPLLGLVRRLEAAFPTIEEAGCKIGIGVATGADQVFIAPFAELDVEPDRKLPLVMTRDILSGDVQWRGLGVINPFGPDGGLVRLSAYPKLAAYFAVHGAAIKARHVSKKNPGGWYRTIDRIYPELARVPKLLIPDIKGKAHIVYEPGGFYPHHNLYFVTADDWDLRALQAVLMSDVTHAFIALYSTKMRGGYLRFQAQYLRRLRLPLWHEVPDRLRRALRSAAEARDSAACNAATAQLYGLSSSECLALTAPNGAADAA